MFPRPNVKSTEHSNVTGERAESNRDNRSVPVFRSPSPSRDLASSSSSSSFSAAFHPFSSSQATDPELKPRYGSRDTINARDIKLFAIVSPSFVGDTGHLVSSRVSSASSLPVQSLEQVPSLSLSLVPTPLLISLGQGKFANPEIPKNMNYRVRVE